MNNIFKLRERLNYKAILSALFFIACCGSKMHAQTISAGGQAYITISDIAVLVAGATYANNMKVQFTGGSSSLSNWKLTVQPLTAYFVAQQSGSGDVAQFGYGPNWPISYFSVKLNVAASTNSWNNANSINAIGAVSTTVPLTSSEVTLVQRSNYTMVGQDYFAMAYNLIQTGSRQLLALHRDNYTIVMRFRLYNQSGTLVSQMDYSHQIGLWPGWLHLPQSVTPPITNGILLQNGGSNVSLNFSDASAYSTGVETALNNSLQISSDDGEYQVKVQTLSNYFSKSGAATTLPVNKIRLTATPNTSSVVSTYNPVNLSTTSTTLITNSTSGNAGVVNNYNLKYSTKQNSNQSAFMNIAEGSYQTQITFIMNPL